MQNIDGSYLSSSQGINIFWQAWRPDCRPKASVVLSHGYGEHSSRYAGVGEALTGAGYALYALDHRGHGRSEGGRGQTPSYACLLEDFGLLVKMARKEHPGMKCFIYGHSLGGNIALNYALKHPQNLSGVIATAPLLKFGAEPPVWKSSLVKVLNRLAPDLTMEGNLEVEAICRDKAVVRAYTEDPLVHDKVSMRMGNEILVYNKLALEKAATLAIPALLLHGSADRITSTAGTRLFADCANQTDVTYIEYEGLYHEIHSEPERDKVFADMIAWLDSRI